MAPLRQGFEAKTVFGPFSKMPTKAQSARRLGREVKPRWPCLLYPRKRTRTAQLWTSALGKKRTSVMMPSAILDDFADHLLAAMALKGTPIMAWFIGLDAR
jgi:hypothetical protein